MFSKFSMRLFNGSKWSMSFLLSVILISLINLGFLIFIFVNFEVNITTTGKDGAPAETRTIPTYLSIFMFAQIYQCLLAWNALRNQNIIQIIGMCIFYAALLAYAGIQYSEINDAVSTLTNEGIYQPSDWNLMSSFIIAVPCVIGVGLIVNIYLSFKLYREFGWSVYKNVGADLALKRRYLAYLIFETLLKFDFFFFLGFTLQFLVIVSNIKRVEFVLTIIVIPLTIVFLYLVLVVTKRESKIGMLAMIVVFFAGLAYFLFKSVRMYQGSQADKYLATRKTLTTFAVLTIVLLVATIINAVICMINFGKGLKPIIHGPSRDDRDNIPEEKYPMVAYGESSYNNNHQSDYDIPQYTQHPQKPVVHLVID